MKKAFSTKQPFGKRVVTTENPIETQQTTGENTPIKAKDLTIFAMSKDALKTTKSTNDPTAPLPETRPVVSSTLANLNGRQKSKIGTGNVSQSESASSKSQVSRTLDRFLPSLNPPILKGSLTLEKQHDTEKGSVTPPDKNTNNASVRKNYERTALKKPTIIDTSTTESIKILSTLTERNLTAPAENNNSTERSFTTIQIACTNWKLWNDGQFQVLDNGTVFVNVTNKLYDWSEYVWENNSVWICDKNQTNTSPMIIPVENNEILSLLTFAGMMMSIISLVFVLVTYSLFNALRTPPGINLMNLSVSILLAQLLWLVGSDNLTEKPMACTAIAVLLHYFFQVSFVWTSYGGMN